MRRGTTIKAAPLVKHVATMRLCDYACIALWEMDSFHFQVLDFHVIHKIIGLAGLDHHALDIRKRTFAELVKNPGMLIQVRQVSFEGPFVSLVLPGPKEHPKFDVVDSETVVKCQADADVLRYRIDMLKDEMKKRERLPSWKMFEWEWTRHALATWKYRNIVLPSEIHRPYDVADGEAVDGEPH